MPQIPLATLALLSVPAGAEDQRGRKPNSYSVGVDHGSGQDSMVMTLHHPDGRIERIEKVKHPLDNSCPRCGATIGTPCDPLTLGRWPFHRARLEACHD